MKNLEATKLARKALKKSGAVRYSMYTNKYGSSRTVKAYIGSHPGDRQAVMDELAAVFGDDMPVVEIETYRRPYPGSYDETTAIIRLPYSKYEL